MRIHRPDIRAVQSLKLVYELNANQSFHETTKAYEIWQDEPLMLIKRIPKVRIYWTHIVEEVAVTQGDTQ